MSEIKPIDIYLDFTAKDIVSIQCTQYDEYARTLIIHLLDNGKEFLLDNSSHELKFKMGKKDGTCILNVCTINTNGTATYVLTPQTCAFSGVYEVQFILYNMTDKTVIHTIPAKLNIAQSVVNNNVIESSNEFNALNRIILDEAERVERAENLETLITTNETTRQENETIRINNELNRVDSETIRATNEDDRKENEQERIIKEEDRIESEEQRQIEENRRISAEEKRIVAEALRDTAEINRDVAETIRTTNESNRRSNESVRMDAELTREINENTRIQNEIDRNTAETQRNSSENIRQISEEARQYNENARNASENIRKENEVDRVNNENERVIGYAEMKESFNNIQSQVSQYYTNSEIDNKFSALETQIDWKESVDTYNDIATVYPNPQDGWTVNVKDTDYTYRYNGKNWIVVSVNAIPKATQFVDGLLTSIDKINYDDANTKKHTHENKSVLDIITTTLFNAWNSAVEHISDTVKHITISERTLWNTVSNKLGKNETAISSAKLATPRKIGEASFDGTTDISLEDMGVEQIIQSVQAEVNQIENAKTDTGTYLNLTDTLKGKAQLVDLVHNLIKTVNGTFSYKSVSYACNNGHITASGTADSSGGRNNTIFRQIIPLIYLEGGKTYTLHKVGSYSGATFALNYENGDLFKYLNSAINTFTIETSGYYSVGFNVTSGSVVEVDFYLQLNEGETAHPYVPYEGYEAKSAGNNNFSGVIEQGSCWGGTLDNSTIRISSDYTPIKQAEEYLVTYDLADRCFCVFYDTSKVFTTQDSVMTVGKKTFKASADGYVRVILAYNNDRNITPNDGDFNLRVMPVEDTVFITNDTDTAYINTYDGVTNIYADTTLNVRYGNTPTVNDVVTNKGDVDSLKYKEVKGEWVTLRDSLSGKCEVKASVYNLWSSGDVSGTGYQSITLDTPIKAGTYTISTLATSSDTDAMTSRISIVGASGTLKILNMTRDSRTSQTFDVSEPITQLTFYASTGGSTSSSDTYSFTDIMITEGDTVKPYVPYSYSVKSVGENLIPYPYLITSETTQGVSITVNDDGTINFSGTITGGIYAFLTKTLSLKAGTYTLSGTANGSSLTTYRLYAVVNGNYHNDLGNGVTFVLDNDTSDIQIGIVISNSGTAINATFKPMLNTGTTPLPYKPYTSSTATLSVDTPTAYLDTYEGLTQVYSEYDVPLEVKYGVSDVLNDIFITKSAENILSEELSWDNIIDKPTIPTKTSDLVNDLGFKTTDTTYLAGNQLTLSGTTFKLNDACTIIDDWNDAITNGWYMARIAANAPASNWCYGLVIAHNTNYVRQIVWHFATDADVAGTGCNRYERVKHNQVWGSWVETTVRTAVPADAKFTDTNTWRGIQDNLTSTSTTDSLSANQGKILKDLVDGKASSSHTHNYAGSSSPGGDANNALKLNGLISDENATVNTIVKRTSGGHIKATYLNQSSGAEKPTTGSYLMYCNSDGYLRKSSLTNIKNILELGSAAYTASTDYAVKDHTHTIINGTYTGSGGKITPSYIAGGQVRFNMFSGYTGISLPWSGYVDALIMDTYTGNDVPWVTSLGIRKSNGVPRAVIATGQKGNTTTWSNQAELITSGNYNEFCASLNHTHSRANASTAGMVTLTDSYSSSSGASSGVAASALAVSSLCTWERYYAPVLEPSETHDYSSTNSYICFINQALKLCFVSVSFMAKSGCGGDPLLIGLPIPLYDPIYQTLGDGYGNSLFIILEDSPQGIRIKCDSDNGIDLAGYHTTFFYPYSSL